ncbi:hypothetical protein [Pseudobdellovibrio exovorus]|uniref:Uncharacterized protein n=1 Tax=Pseudobdellovibrio exovorus JSS TaxID=1184267 RepID=M4V4X5_9BACT|nr:hypothetical protein [Pseudobdellovibrio exovorus]AGH94228.1 hypothetical protein A11Q_8 [Pseudobdellovibrio exovorus JSS]
MIKNTAVSMVLYTLLAAGLGYYLYGPDQAFSIATGGVIMLLTLMSFVIVFAVVFYKKLIALAVFVIILKYVILGLILWNLSSAKWLKPIGLIIGLASLLIAILVATFMKSVSKEKL